MTAKQEAVRHAGGERFAETMATIYVGEQLERIANALEAGSAPAVYYEAIHTGDDPHTFVPGGLVRPRR